MQAPTREEVDLKLVNLELRSENRMAAMERNQEEIINLVRETRELVRETVRETQERFRSLQRTMILTGISSVFAIAGLNYALIGNLTAVYDVGRANGKELAEMSATLKQMQAQLNAIESAQGHAAAPPKK